jgi:serine/threonine-protein kinase
MDTDRNLLFAVLALQAGAIDRDRFIEACALWATHKDVPIGQLLVERDWLKAEARNAVELLLELNLLKHDGDARASLMAAARSEARGALASIADADVQRSLAALPDSAPAADPFATNYSPESECAGRNILYEEIGRGGMGCVHRGHDPELRRDLAVKVLREEYSGDADVELRFVEEAQIGGQLQHPGIVPVYELGRFADRRPFFTMKLVKGRTLAALLKERPDLRHEQARFLTIFEQVCQTVAYAHSKGVIHRDLKPGNVMVGAFGEVQVMDWGLAKVLVSEDEAEPDATVHGTRIRTARSGSTEGGRTGVVGTPAFMPPEQARGDVEGVDERADVFGLGGILCAILTGQPPYTATDHKELLRKAATGDVTAALAQLSACGADAELVMLCAACLAPERERRPREAGVVAARMAAYASAVQERLRAAELERVAAEARAEEAKATAAAERTARRRTRALAAALLALVAVGAGGGLWVQHEVAGRRADQARREAEQRAEQARREAEQRQLVESALEKATAMREGLRFHEAATMLEHGRMTLGDFGSEDLRRRLDVAGAELALVVRLDAIRQRRATIVDGNFDYRTTDHEYAVAFREARLGEVGDDEAAVAARVRNSGVSGPLVAALDDWAYAAEEPRVTSWVLGVARLADPHPWRDRFRDPTVWRDGQALLALVEEALRDNAARAGELSAHLVVSLSSLLGGGAEALALLRAAQRRYPSDFWLSLALGNAHHRTRNWGEAVGYYRVAVALRANSSAAHNNLGYALYDKEDLAGAIAEFRRAVDLAPSVAMVHNNLGVVLRANVDLEEGIAEFHRAISLDPNLVYAHNNLGLALAGSQDADGAIAEYRKAIDIDRNFALAHYNLGCVLHSLGKLEEAIAEYRTAIGCDPKLAMAHYNLGNALAAQKHLDEAIGEYRKAIDCDPGLVNAYINLGQALQEKKDLNRAIAAYREAIEIDRKFGAAHLYLGSALREKKELISAIAEFRAAAMLYADAFAANPQLATDLHAQHRYSGACSAALAAGVQAEGAHGLPDKEQLMLRRQALGWLRADLVLHAKLAEREEPAAKQTVRQTLQLWQKDTDLASVRDRPALAQLPGDERQAWRQLWADVAVLLKKVEEKK